MVLEGFEGYVRTLNELERSARGQAQKRDTLRYIRR